MSLNTRLCIQFLLGPLLIGWQVCVFAAGTNGVADEHSKRLTEQARALDHGVGVAMDLEQAAGLYCEAARLGYAPAQYYLGWMYATGRGMARDKSAAAALFALAAKQGHSQARNMLRLVDADGGKLPDCMRDDIGQSAFIDSAERRRIAGIVRQLAPAYNVQPELALAIINVESNFNSQAVSVKNAQGLMQLIPDTAARFNVRNSFDPAENIRGGLSYLRWLLAYFQGDVSLVAAGYNAGEKVVDRYRGIPPYPETQAYVKRVMQIVKQEKHPYDATVTAPSPSFVMRLSARD